MNLSHRVVLAGTLLALAGCKQSMIQQKKYGFDAPSRIWRDGTSSRPIPAGAVAQGDLEADRIAEGPPPISMGLLQRGRERYDIYCAVCHGFSGQGDGMIVQRGFPHPPSYHSDRLRAAPASHFYDVISNGYGVMYPYAARVAPADRWAIVAYIRALQFSQGVALADIPDLGGKLP